MENLGTWIISVLVMVGIINLIVFLFMGTVAFLSWDLRPLSGLYGTWEDFFGLFRFSVFLGTILGTIMWNDIKD